MQRFVDDDMEGGIGNRSKDALFAETVNLINGQR